MSEKGQHSISPKLLEAMGGIKDENGLIDGSYLWGVAHDERSLAIQNHSFLVADVAVEIGNALIASGKEEYQNLNPRDLFLAALNHDAGKQYGVTRELLSEENKTKLGISAGFKEESSEVDEKVVNWLKNLNLSPESLDALQDHNFPTQIYENPYWKIILVADYMCGQEVTDIQSRVDDVGNRWVYDRIKKGTQPRISPERFEIAKANILDVAREIFSILGTTDKEFIAEHRLGSEEVMSRTTRFLRKTTEKHNEERARKLVGLLIGQGGKDDQQRP